MTKFKGFFKVRIALILFIFLSIINASQVKAQDLIPAKAKGPLYNYFCTWAIQNYLNGWGKETFTIDSAVLNNGAAGAINEKWLKGNESWLNFYPKIHSDLIFLLDDGYNVNGKNTMEIDTLKFPSFNGTPQERQKKLADYIAKAGWGGLGLWSRGIKPTPEARERILWSRDAGVKYWKVDGGDDSCIYDSLRDMLYPNLVIEHATWPGEKANVSNYGPKGSLMDGYVEQRSFFLENTDVVRIYDIDQPMGQVTGLARVAGLFKFTNGNKKAKAIINCEDLVTVGAALGCSYGIFRFPVSGKRLNGDPDIFNAGPRQTKKRMDEVVRAVRWQRIAPPFSAGVQLAIIDSILLTDTMTIKSGESWDNKLVGTLIQSAPARVCRGLALPIVKADGDVPFVIASKHPNGAVSIATLGCHSDVNGYKIPLADITFNIGAIPSAIGVFGYYKSLVLHFNAPFKNKRILAQDLAGDKAIDITNQVIINNDELILPGSLISTIGLSNATPGDLSDPGLVIAIR